MISFICRAANKNVEKHYQVKIHTVQVFVLVARLLGSVMRATTFLWKPSLVR